MIRVKLSMGRTVSVVCGLRRRSTHRQKDTFWSDVEEGRSLVPDNERLFIGEDLNRHVGRDENGWENVRGGWGIRERFEKVKLRSIF